MAESGRPRAREAQMWHRETNREKAHDAALRAILARAERWIDDVDHQDLNLLDDIRAALGMER